MSVIAMLISSYAIRLAVSLHNGMSHDSNNNNHNSRNVDGTLMVLHRNFAEDIIMSQRNQLMTFF